MFNLESNIKIYLATGHTDMRKGINGLSILANKIISDQLIEGALFVFRGKRSDRMKVLWWDGQGYCLYYKCMDSGKFTWPADSTMATVGITKAQLSMLIEGIDWRRPKWSNRPVYSG